MDIAIIGTGNVGSALAGAFVRAGHDVTIAGRDIEKTRQVASSVGATPASTGREAAVVGQIVVLAIPFASAEAVAAEIADVVDGKVVIDVSNPFNATFDGLLSDTGLSAAERIQAWLPDARVVKAFNTVFASRQADPTAGEPIDAFVASDDRAAAELVLELAGSIGMRQVAALPLSSARYLEGLAFLNIGLNRANSGSWQSSWRLVGAPVPVAA